MKLNRMTKIACLLISPLALTLVGGTYAQDQHPILDQVANKVIQKYQTSTCQQLWMEKANKQPPTPQQQKAIQFLQSDPQMRALFINKVAAPVANKMFECGMIP
ncbi:MAG: hypothetical protein WA869_13020 [Alloacidobacterium sp.]|jgi:hypothetical protein